MEQLAAELGVDGGATAPGLFERTGLSARAERVFAIEHPLEREEEIVELVSRFPAASELVRLLSESGWLHDDPLADALFARDALESVLFPPDERHLVEVLAPAAALAASDPLLQENRFLTSADELFAERLSEALRNPSSVPPRDEHLTQIRREVMRQGELDGDQADELIAAAGEMADLDAAWLLDRFEGWSEQELERIDCLVAVYNRATALQLGGFPSVAAYLLRRAAQQLDDGEAWRRLTELALDQGWLAAAESLLVRFGRSAPRTEWTALMARLHVLRGELDRATRLLRPLAAELSEDPEDLAVEAPLFVLASVECALAGGGALPGIDAFPLLLDADPRRLGVSRAAALLEVAQHDLPSDEALAPLWAAIERAPLHEARWNDLDLLVEGSAIGVDLLHGALAGVLNAHPQAVAVWRNVIPFLGDADAERWRELLEQRVAEQTGRSGGEPKGRR
ncbi:MAG: hypothetical protein KC609_21110 [Myxococcales bacterium]|nr:hypothetical protein [Myxococcales bacterium]